MRSDHQYVIPGLETAIGLRLDVIASRIPPSGLRRIDGESDAEFRQRVMDAYHAFIEGTLPERCAYCGCFCPCVCFSDLGLL